MLLSTMLAALAAHAAARPCTGPEAPTEAAVRAVEHRWVHMIEAHDTAGLACLLAPEFTDTNWAGQRIARAAVLPALPHRPRARLELSDLTVALHGKVAIVRGLNRQTNAAGKAAGTVRFTDIFVHRGGHWQAVSAQETPLLGEQ